MKYLLSIASAFFLLVSCNAAKAQSFTVVNDTIQTPLSSSGAAAGDTILTGSSPVTYSWRVISSNFPPDWLDSSSVICDNILCHSMRFLWPVGTTQTSAPYLAPDNWVLNFIVDLTPSSTRGCYYITARLHNVAIPADSATETWVVCYPPSGLIGLQTKTITRNGMVLYPNPVGNELNVTYGMQQGAVQVVVYDVLGRKVMSAPCSNGGVALDTRKLNKGMYLLHLCDDAGRVLASEKFAKE